jgi:hypothetical protein
MLFAQVKQQFKDSPRCVTRCLRLSTKDVASSICGGKLAFGQEVGGR